MHVALRFLHYFLINATYIVIHISNDNLCSFFITYMFHPFLSMDMIHILGPVKAQYGAY